MTADSQASDQLQAVQLIDAMLEDLSLLARNPSTTPIRFYSQVVDQISAVLEPLAAHVWIVGPEDIPVLVQRKQNPGWGQDANSRFSELLSPLVAAPHTLVETISNGQEKCTLVVCPVHSRNNVWGMLSICVNETVAAAATFGRILEAVAEICTDFLSTHEATSISDTKEYWEELLRFSLTSHSSLEEREVAYHIANDMRVLLECDRVTLFRLSGSGPKLLAMSSVAVIDNKTRTARWMKQLVRAALKAKQPVFSRQQVLPPQLTKQLSQFEQETGFGLTAIIPVGKPPANQSSGSAGKTPGRPLAALVVEASDDSNRIELVQRLTQTLPHVSVGFANARRFSSIPLRRPLAAIAVLLSAFKLGNLPKTLAALLVIAAITAALLLVKIDMRVRVDGELRPVDQRNIFAPMESVVDEILVRHGDPVVTGQELAQLRSPDLELELKSIAGELDRIDQRIETKRITLNQAATGNTGDQIVVSQLAGEISDLEQEQRSLESQQELLQAKSDRLKIVSEIDGEVVSWKAETTLKDRPVRRGDVLLRVADVAAGWQLVFEVPEHRVGYLLQRREELGEGETLKVAFFFQSNPSVTFQADVIEFAESTQSGETGPTVTMICSIPEKEIEHLRHGATVIGKVNCGKRSVGYVWTFELIDSIRRRLVW